jgi:hypothetical protein
MKLHPARWPFVTALLALGGCGGGDSEDPCSGVGCSSRGFCMAQQGNAYCACITGFHPVLLECVANVAAAPCTGITCSGHGTCRPDGVGVTCDCATGFEHLLAGDPRCAGTDVECDLICVPVVPGDGGGDGDVADARPDGEIETPTDGETDARPDSEADARVDGDADADATPDVDAGPVCSNGVTEPPEECDGNSRSCGDCDTGTQSCRADCTWGGCTGESGCSPSDTRACGPCDDGVETCQADCSWGSCDIDNPASRCESASDSIDCSTGDCDGTAWCNTSSCYYGACRCASGSRSCTASSGCPGTQSCSDGGSTCSWGGCVAYASCDTYEGYLVCHGQRGLTDSGCTGGHCHTCTCSDGSWGGSCTSCATCPW